MTTAAPRPARRLDARGDDGGGAGRDRAAQHDAAAQCRADGRKLRKSLNEKPVTEKTVDRILSDKQPREGGTDPEQPALNLQSSPVTPLSPSACRPRSRRRARVPTCAWCIRWRRSRLVQTAAAASLRGIADPPMQPRAAVPARSPMRPCNRHRPRRWCQCRRAAGGPVMPAAVPTPRHEEHKFRVLAVDDSPLMRTFLQNKLSPYGIAPEFASSGEEALFKISKQHFDLIFLDVMLPGMDGYDVCKMIKKNKDNNLMKVVMLTSKDKTFDKIRGTMAGCDGYLTKPVDEMKLRAIIERHSVRRSDAHGSTMTERILIMRHASGLVNRARRMAIEKWPQARLEVHDLAAYGKPPADFRWDRYAHMLIDDEYLRREGLLWLSELRTKPNFPRSCACPPRSRATSRPPRSRSRRHRCRRSATSRLPRLRPTSNPSARTEGLRPG